MPDPRPIPSLPEGWRGPWFHRHAGYGSWWWVAGPDDTEVRLLDDGRVVTFGRPALADLLAVLAHLAARHAGEGGSGG